MVLLDGERLDRQEVQQERPENITKIFIQWLIRSVTQKSLLINQHDSVIHRVEEGLFLMKLDIIKLFLKENPEFGILFADHEADLAQFFITQIIEYVCHYSIEQNEST